jgi:hypothetical protein
LREIGFKPYTSKIEAGKILKCIETASHEQQYEIVRISAVTWGE